MIKIKENQIQRIIINPLKLTKIKIFIVQKKIIILIKKILKKEIIKKQMIIFI